MLKCSNPAKLLEVVRGQVEKMISGNCIFLIYTFFILRSYTTTFKIIKV